MVVTSRPNQPTTTTPTAERCAPHFRASKAMSPSSTSPVVVDFDAILSQYTGNAIVDRLLCVAERANDVKVSTEALKHVKKALERVDEFSKPTTSNGCAYERAMKLAEKLGLGDAGFSRAWLEENDARANAELEKLESGLSDLFSAERVKEHVRMQYVELGDHYYDRGDLKNALTCYMRTRDHCSNPKHVIFMCLSVMAVSLELENFAHVNVYANKAASSLDLLGDDDGVTAIKAKIACACGIALLRTKRFKEAAVNFTNIPTEVGTSYASVCSARDVATYGALCALASFDRQSLQSLVLENNKGAFRAHLEAASDIREVVNDFYNARYTSCFSTLNAMRRTLELDLHLGQHIDELYRLVRERAMIQYTVPYVTVDLTVMAESFNTDAVSIVEELATLIEKNKIEARIDSKNKTLVPSCRNERAVMFKQVLQDADDYEIGTRSALLRLSLLKHDVVVRPDVDATSRR